MERLGRCSSLFLYVRPSQVPQQWAASHIRQFLSTALESFPSWVSVRDVFQVCVESTHREGQSPGRGRVCAEHPEAPHSVYGGKKREEPHKTLVLWEGRERKTLQRKWPHRSHTSLLNYYHTRTLKHTHIHLYTVTHSQAHSHTHAHTYIHTPPSLAASNIVSSYSNNITYSSYHYYVLSLPRRH